uniref:BZIP domain-containing protein n=1 Tax=Romanomermis culicivorax TaxID=13658 RepID=A0A915K277_ROMCU
MDNTSKTINDLITDEDLKKKYLERDELLERNRISASKYRRKKKEEFYILAEKMQMLEDKKRQLQAQILVLKMELDRVKELWDDHTRNHNCTSKQNASTVQTIIVKDSNGVMRVMEIEKGLLKLSTGQPKSFIQIRTVQNTK